MRQSKDYIWAMIVTNLRTIFADPKSLFISASTMALNNIAWFMVWWLFFHFAQNLNGWALQDVARLFSITAMAYGLAFAFSAGAWYLSQTIREGELDLYLGYPKPVLATVLLGRSDLEGLGDIASGFVVLFLFGHMGPWTMISAFGLSALSAVIILALTLVINSSVFWKQTKAGVTEQILDISISLTSMPQHGLPVFVRALLFTLIPVGFVAFLPADILREFAWWKLLALLFGAGLSLIAAIKVFYRGLRRYTSGNRIMSGF